MANFLDGLLSGKNAFTQTTASFAQPAVGANVTVPVVFSGWTAVGMAVFLEVGGNYQVVSIPNDSSIQIKNLGSSGNAAVSASVPPGRMAPAGAPGANGSSGASIPAPALVATSNVTLSGNVVVDGVATNTLAAGSYVLVTEQSTSANKGPWIVNNAGAWTRPTWYDSDAEVAALLGITTGAVLGGSTGAGSVWFQSAGLTIAGAKTFTKLSTPALLQDALSVTLPAQTLTQYKGAFIDPLSGRNAVDHDRRDIREFGANPNGAQQTTATAAGLTGAIVLAAPMTGLRVGNWLMLQQLGAAHGMTTPAAPLVVAQGVTGSRTLRFKFVAMTSTGGYTQAGAATTISNANAAIGIQGADFEYPTYVEAWPSAPVPGASKYLVYCQFDGSGADYYVGAIIAWALFDADGNAMPQGFRLVTATLPAVPEHVPATAPGSAVPNGLRTQVAAMASTTAITVSPVPLSTGAAVVATLCNKLPIEAAMQAISFGYGGECRVPFGNFYCTGDLEIDNPVRLEGGNCGSLQAGSVILFRDGHGAMVCNYTQGLQRQPATLYQLGDRVVASLRTGVRGCWTATAITAGKTWGLSATGGDPNWNYTPGGTTTDGEITWTFQSTSYLTSADGALISHLAFRAAGKTIPAQRSVANNDLRLAPVYLRTVLYVAGNSYAAGDYVLPTASKATGKAYRCTTPGTTAGEATWNRLNGGTTTQGGTAVFTAVDMRQLQGAGLLVMVPAHLEYVQTRDFCGTGIFGEGNNLSNGGNIDRCRWRCLDSSGNTGQGILVQGADGNGVSLSDTTFSTRPAGHVGMCTFQDNSFYGAVLSNVIGNGNQRFQNQPYNSAQSGSLLITCYTEADAPGDCDWNLPGRIIGGNMRLRPGATAYRIGFSEVPSGCFNSPIYETDQAVAGTGINAQRILVNGYSQHLFGNPLTGGYVQGGTLLQEETGGITVDGRSSRKILNRAVTTDQLDHYGARGYCPIMPNGVRLGAGGFTQESFLTSVTAVPTVGLFKQGDVFLWALDTRRLAILVGRTGGLGSVARANSTPYLRGDIITTGGKLFRCTVPGTSAATLPAAFAAASIGTQVNDGATALFHCWGVDQGPLLYALPNWSIDAVAIADGNYQTTSGKTGADGPTFALAAATANRTIDVLTTGAVTGDGVEFTNNNNVAFTWTLNSGSGGSAIIVLPTNYPCKVRLKYNGTAWVLDSLVSIGLVPAPVNVRTFSGTTDTALAIDHGGDVESTGASAAVVTIPSFPKGTVITYAQQGAGALSFTGSGVTLETALASSGATSAQYQVRTLVWRTATNVRIQ